MQYNVLIIGAGNMASGYDNPEDATVLTHAHAIIKSSCLTLLGFYDIDRNKAQEAARKWGVNFYCDIENIPETVDVICCVVPDQFHYDVMCRCANVKDIKLVICEKPITQSSIQAERIIEKYLQRDIHILVNYTRRYLQEFMQLKEAMAFMGELRVGYGLYGKGLIHNCSHMINILEFLLGKLELHSVGQTVYDYFLDDPSVEFVLAARMGKIFFSPIPCNEVTVFEFELFFSKGKVRYSDSDCSIEYFRVEESDIYKGEINYKLYKKVSINITQALIGLYQNVRAVLERETLPLCNGYEACRTLEICEKIMLMENDCEKTKGSSNH